MRIAEARLSVGASPNEYGGWRQMDAEFLPIIWTRPHKAE
jgi:hypothetical protein